MKLVAMAEIRRVIKVTNPTGPSPTWHNFANYNHYRELHRLSNYTGCYMHFNGRSIREITQILLKLIR